MSKYPETIRTDMPTVDTVRSLARTVDLPDEAATLRLGANLARFLRKSGAPRLVLLSGPLGAGKTCLVRGLAAALPGGEEAEVASPSFSLCNLYPTCPPVAHVDLYRTGIALPESAPEAGSRLILSDEVLELVDSGETLVIVEWAEYFPAACLPETRLEVKWLNAPVGRHVRLTLHGAAAEIEMML